MVEGIVDLMGRYYRGKRDPAVKIFNSVANEVSRQKKMSASDICRVISAIEGVRGMTQSHLQRHYSCQYCEKISYSGGRDISPFAHFLNISNAWSA